MERSTKFYGQVFVVLTICFSLTGCDQVTALLDQYLKPKDTPTPAQAPVDPTPAPKAMKKSASIPANAIASVGDWFITQDEFQERLNGIKEVVPDFDITDMESKRLVLDELVRQQVLLKEAEASGLAKRKDIVDAVDEFRRTLVVREIVQSITGNISVSDEEAQEFYEENKNLLIEPLQYRVSEIVVEQQDAANNILIEILKGVDFAELARQHSVAASASKGGDLGVLTEEPFPQMVNALLNLEEGDVSSVFKGPSGYHIVKLTEKKGGVQIPFDEVKEEIIETQLLQKQQAAILQHIENVQKKIKVEVKEDLL